MSDKSAPAFPFQEPGVTPCYGLTKREWFAGMALQGILASPGASDPELGVDGDTLKQRLAKWAFSYADTMLAESEKP